MLLFVPIAIASPTLSILWALPLTLWVVRGQSTVPAFWHRVPKRTDLALTPRIGQAPLIVYCVAVTVLILTLAAVWRRPGEGSRRAHASLD